MENEAKEIGVKKNNNENDIYSIAQHHRTRVNEYEYVRKKGIAGKDLIDNRSSVWLCIFFIIHIATIYRATNLNSDRAYDQRKKYKYIFIYV